MTFPIYAVVGIPVIGLLGLLGALAPPTIAFFFPKYGVTQKYYFSFFNGLAAGLILAVGFVHSIPDSFESFGSVLTDEDSQVESYAWPAWISMMGVIICFSLEELVDSISMMFGVSNPHTHGHGHGHGHAAHAAPHTDHDDHACGHSLEDHEQNDGECDAQPLEEMCDHHRGAVSTDDELEVAKGDKPEKAVPKESDDELDVEGGDLRVVGVDPQARTRRIVKMFVLFFGLLFHNVFVGLALGTADNDKALFIAIIFHQFFEGLGLGSRVAVANLKRFLSILIIDLIFAASAPLGIGIGIGIKSAIEDDDYAYNIVDGTFQALSGGILVYVALVHMFRGYTEIGVSGKALHWHKLSSYVGLLLGAAIMSVIGIWA
jgi:zinc transporter 1/2/3